MWKGSRRGINMSKDIDNSIKIYLISKRYEIEQNNKTSDNKAYHIHKEKVEVVGFLIKTKRISESNRSEALKILGLKNLK